MEENKKNQFFTEDCIIKDEYYNSFKKVILCKICFKILKEPMMCTQCQVNYCKNCIEDWSKDHSRCPQDCEIPNYIKNIDKESIISNLKYRCNNCQEEVKYSQIESHLSKGCEKNENSLRLSESIYKKKKLIKLTEQDIKKLKQNKEEINYLTSKKYFYFIFIF